MVGMALFDAETQRRGGRRGANNEFVFSRLPPRLCVSASVFKHFELLGTTRLNRAHRDLIQTRVQVFPVAAFFNPRYGCRPAKRSCMIAAKRDSDA